MAYVVDALVSVAREWYWSLWERNYRGMLVVHDESGGVAYSLARLASTVFGDAIVFASRDRRGVWSGFRAYSPARVQSLLGSEHGVVVIDVSNLLLPNLLAAVAEMVRAPGVVLLRVDCPWRWDAGGWMGTGGYTRYLMHSFDELESLLWLDACTGRVLGYRLPGRRGERPWPPGGEVVRVEDDRYKLLPRVVRRAVATRDQAEAVLAAYRFTRGGYRSLLLVGDRGRGKSAALGLALALMVLRKDVGMVTVTAPSPYGVQSLFAMLSRVLREAGVQHSLVRRGDVVIGVKGPWFHVRYHTPAELYEPGGLLVVDEAAAIGMHRLRMLARRARRIAAATTVHGYEGSGRTLLHLVERVLPGPILRVELKTPIRYPPGDPLEAWLYGTFVLRREEGEATVDTGSLECIEVDGWRLAGDPSLARLAYEVLSEAHYRNEPDDLALMLDAPHYRVYMLMAGSVPVAVAEVSLEWMTWSERRMLESVTGLSGRVARIVRIAVRPRLQRKGLGTRLLRCLEDALASRYNADYVGAIYSRGDVTRFWLRNGYRVVYVSPRFNKATGEKNIAVAKALRGPVYMLAEAERRARVKLLVAGQTVYRDLPAEVLSEVLRVEPLLSKPLSMALEDWQERELRRFLEGRADHEAVWDSVWAAVVSVLAARSLSLTGRHGLALVARIVQGKPLSEVAALLGVDRSVASRLVDEAARGILRQGRLGWV